MEMFYDSVTPGNIPAGSRACLYYDGDFAATAQEAVRFAATRWITIEADYVHCSIVDFEEGNPAFDIPGTLKYFVTKRTESGHRAIVYTDLDNLPKVQSELAGHEHELWIGTLDGNMLTPTYVPRLWGVQFAGGKNAPFDTSVLYGKW